MGRELKRKGLAGTSKPAKVENWLRGFGESNKPGRAHHNTRAGKTLSKP